MIVISTCFNPVDKKFSMLLDTKLVNKYFANLSGLVKKVDELPNDVVIEKLNFKTALITFSVNPMTQDISSEGEVNKIKPVSGLMKTVYNFVIAAIRHEYKKTEFIPLEGYPIEKMQKEVPEAVKNKRRLCIIKDYNEFLNAEKTSKPIYHQYMIEPGSSEYADVVIMIYKGDLEQIKKIYKDKLKLEDWS
jgi:hypothetical protein